MPDPAGGIDPAGLIATLFQAEAARLTSLARFFVDDRTAAEDLVQEAFIRLALARPDPRRGAPRHTCARSSSTWRGPQPAGLDVFPTPPTRPAGRTVGQKPPPLTWRVVPRSSPSCDGCPLRQRDCLVLRYYLDLGIDEIAATLQISRNSVKTHLQRGLRTMESSLEARQ
jgi:hypothetical protein